MKKNIKIIMFAPWFPPHRNSEAHTTGNLVLAMLKHGWHVDVISEPRYELFDNIQYTNHWINLKNYCYPVPIRKGQPSIFSQYADKWKSMLTMKQPIKGCSWAFYAFEKAMELLKRNNYDIILSRSPVLYGHLPALHLVSKIKMPWVANWNDLEPASRAPFPYNEGRDNKSDYFTEHFVTTVVSAATHHTLPSKRLLDYMTYWASGLKSKATIVPHIALDNSDDKPCAKRDKFTLCHAGIFDGSRDPKPLLQAIDQFIKKYPDRISSIEFVLLGNSFNSTFDYSIPDNIRDIIKILPWCDYEQSLDIMQHSSVLLIVEADMKEGIVLPAKLADYIYCRRPILTLSPLNGTMHDLITSYGGGIVANCKSSDDIMSALEKLYTSWASNLLEKEYPLNAIESAIGEKAVIAKYEEIFSSLGIFQ